MKLLRWTGLALAGVFFVLGQQSCSTTNDSPDAGPRANNHFTDRSANCNFHECGALADGGCGVSDGGIAQSDAGLCPQWYRCTGGCLYHPDTGACTAANGGTHTENGFECPSAFPAGSTSGTGACLWNVCTGTGPGPCCANTECMDFIATHGNKRCCVPVTGVCTSTADCCSSKCDTSQIPPRCVFRTAGEGCLEHHQCASTNCNMTTFKCNP